MSDLLEIRVIGAPAIAEQAVTRLATVLDLDRESGPRPSRKSPGLVLYYLTGRLRPDEALSARRARLLEEAERDQLQANLAARHTGTPAPRRRRAAR
jgi:hypothetical protein